MSPACSRISCRWPATAPLPTTRRSWAASRRFRGRRVMVIGHEKGDDTASRLKHNFGMGKPEGYRKAIRLMQLADRFGLPVLTLGRHVGRVSRRAGRGARPGRSDRALDRGVPALERADGRGGRRRGRFGRRDRAGGGQPRADVRTRRLFGDLARGLRVDPVAHRRQGAGRGRGDEDHRAGPEGARRDRHDRAASRWAARIAIPMRRSPRWAMRWRVR